FCDAGRRRSGLCNLFRWYEPPHPGAGDAGYPSADREPPADAALRRIHEEWSRARPPHVNNLMVHLKSDKEIEKLRASADLVGRALGEVAKYVRPGASTNELDRVAEEFITTHGARPA